MSNVVKLPERKTPKYGGKQIAAGLVMATAAVALGYYNHSRDSFDELGGERIAGDYWLYDTSVPNQVRIGYASGDWLTALIDEPVCEVGHNSRHIVARARPAESADRVKYYYVTMTHDRERALRDDLVEGPMSEEEFAKKKEELRLPEFTRSFTPSR